MSIASKTINCMRGPRQSCLPKFMGGKIRCGTNADPCTRERTASGACLQWQVGRKSISIMLASSEHREGFPLRLARNVATSVLGEKEETNNQTSWKRGSRANGSRFQICRVPNRFITLRGVTGGMNTGRAKVSQGRGHPSYSTVRG